MEDRELVTVASFTSEVELRVARSLLESEGIMTYVPREFLTGGHHSGKSVGVGSKYLQTPESQAGLARALLAATVSDADFGEAAGGTCAGDDAEE